MDERRYYHCLAVWRRIVCVVVATVVLASKAFAQVSPEEHAKHHPDQAPTTQPNAGPEAGMQGMEEMMRGMGVPPRKDLYPSLMEWPDLSPEKRAEAQAAAHDRMQSGTALMAEGLDQLVRTAATDDYAAMQQAVALLREGMARFDSGLAAHRAIAADSPTDAQQLALNWFKSQMNLPASPGTPLSSEARSPFGLSWSHFLVMALLTTFAIVMIAMYFFKMRRAATLLARLTQAPGGSTVAVPSGRASDTEQPRVLPLAARQDSATPTMDGTTAPSPEAAATAWGGSLRIANVFTETPTIKTFRLVNPTGGAIPFAFLPGQFLTLAVALAGKTVKRCYSIASSAAQRDYVEITVKREEQGAVSRYLHDRVAPGDLLQISAPQGYFTFTGYEADSIVLIGGGVGLTPLMSIIRALTDRGWNHDIYLLYACSTMHEFLYREELERLKRRHHNLHISATLERAESTEWLGPEGYLRKELIAEFVPQLSDKRIHLCGPPPMMDEVQAILLDLGAPRGNILTEAFGPPVSREARQAAVQTAMIEASPQTTATVAFTISGKSAPLPPDTTVLEAAEHVGVSIDNSCRAGTCGACKVRLLKGAVTMAVEDSLSAAERASGIILACQAKATQNLEVEA